MIEIEKPNLIILNYNYQKKDASKLESELTELYFKRKRMI